MDSGRRTKALSHDTIIGLKHERGTNMPDDAPRHLESLTVNRLKSVAKRYGIDVSACKHKKDYVQVLAAAGITEAQVSEVLGPGGAAKAKSVEEAREVSDIKHEIETIAEKSPSDRVLPVQEDEDVERNIDRALLVRPSFFEIDSQIETAWNHMIMADYHDAIKVNSEARSKMLDRFSSFQVFSTALSLRAAESILTNLGDAQGGVDPTLKTVLAEAKKAFIEGSPRRREQSLEELEALTSKAYESFFEGSTKAEAELRTLLSDYESFGTQIQESRRILEIAEQARQSFNAAEYAKLIEEAKSAASRAKDVRASEIEKSFRTVRSAVIEAREAGAALTIGEDELASARDAFDKQAFRRATELLSSIERTADQAHLEVMKDKDARTKQTTRVSTTIAGLEKTLQEAASYGLDVDEGLLFVSRAKGALGNKDLVSAAKLARHAKDQSEDLGAELDKQRIERGVASKVEDAKCGKCGKEMLYSFPNDVRKCIDCGHSFSMVVEPVRTTMEPMEKPVSASQVQEQTTPEESASPEKDAPKKRLLTRSLKKN